MLMVQAISSYYHLVRAMKMGHFRQMEPKLSLVVTLGHGFTFILLMWMEQIYIK